MSDFPPPVSFSFLPDAAKPHCLWGLMGDCLGETGSESFSLHLWQLSSSSFSPVAHSLFASAVPMGTWTERE